MRRLILSVLLLLPLSSYAQSTEVKALASAPETTVGTPVDYDIRISSPYKEIVLDLPEVKKYTPADFRTKGQKKEEDDSLPLFSIESVDITDLSTNDAFRKTVKIRVLYCAPGLYPMPPFAVKENDSPVSFDIPRVNVKAVNESGQTAEIEPPLSLKGNHTRVIILCALIFLLGIAAVVLWRWLKNRKKDAAPEYERPPIETFREDAERIAASLSSESFSAGQFALELSISFRRLISSLYQFDAEEMTSSEILSSIVQRRKGLTAERYGSSLEGIMILWDMTKFAEFAPSAEILRVNLSETVSLAEKMWRDAGGN